MLTLDVCTDESVSACVREVLEREGRLDVLINNAGYEQGGAAEEVSMEEARAQFETNVFGVMRMIKAVLPTMRSRKRGHIVNVSSLAGLSGAPFLGVYAASKFALEGYSETLRLELKPLNIHVSLVEAGFLDTPLKHKRQLAANPISDYDVWRTRAMTAIRQHEDNGPGADLVAGAIRDCIERAPGRLRHVIGKQARQAVLFRWLLPEAMFEQGTRDVFGLDKMK
jgi:NAD(P)-dependent dehydrogenase (short-subunit alcohol dehydrogenase family)